jgi:uncharacterized membrane protein YidH (DUF202 family)
MRRWLGALAIVVGVVVLGLDVDRWDVVVLSVSSGHGLHASDSIGVVLIAVGIAVLWTAPARRPHDATP